MKKLIVTTIVIVFTCTFLYPQEYFGRFYWIKNKLKFGTNEFNNLKQEKFIAYYNLSILTNNEDNKVQQEAKIKIFNKLKLIKEGVYESSEFLDKEGNKIHISNEQVTKLNFDNKTYTINDIHGKTSAIAKNIAAKVALDSDFFAGYNKYIETVGARKPSDSCNLKGDKKKIKGNLLFKENKIMVNPFLQQGSCMDKYRDKTYYYVLKDRQTAKFKFREGRLSTFAIPLKYRFGNDDNDIDEEFAESITASLFAGYTFGKTRFFHRKNVGNKIVTRRLTLGALVGISREELSSFNTDGSDMAPMDSETENIGVMSLGVGSILTYNKFGLGLFAGIDFGVGDIADTWNYNGRPWIGLGIGYDLFKIGDGNKD